MNKMKCILATCMICLLASAPLLAQEDLDKVFDEFDKENKKHGSYFNTVLLAKCTRRKEIIWGHVYTKT